MIFKRLFGRGRRPTRASEDQAGLIRVARDAPDAGVRRDACRRIRRLPELRDLAASDPDTGVREVASARYRTLLCGQEESPDLTQRLEETATLDDQRTLQRVALGGREAELRRAAIARIESQDVLCACALNDPLAVNRSAAVERLDRKGTLERVVKNIGRKDKQVYRIARRKLREIAEREVLPARIRAQCDELCGKLDRLGRFGRWVQDRAMLDLIDRRWAQIAPEAGRECGARYRELRDRFLRAYEEYRGEHTARIAAEEDQEAVQVERRALLQGLRALSALEKEAEVAQGLARITARWDELAPLPDQEQSSLAPEYAAAREAAAGNLEALRGTARNNSRLGELLARAEQALAQTKPLERKPLLGLLEEAGRLLATKGIDQSMAARFAQVREALDARLRTQRTHAEKRLALLPEQVDELASAIEQGSLKAAEPLYRRIVADLERMESSGLPRRAYGEAATRLQGLTPALRGLQGWRRWGTDQGRRELCDAMESLGSQDLPPEAMVLRLQDLRREWKGLDQGGSPVNRSLWERFHGTSERVYERCKPYLEEQAAGREANRRQREQLCRELEDFLERADWERMDWKRAVRARREMRAAWSATGGVEGRHRKGLEKRFQVALKGLDGQLAEERGRNLAHKRALIAQVEALAEEPDLDRAIEQTKELQRQWHTSVAARRQEENRLWQRFRAAGDRVFARRKEQQETYTAELAENLHRREALCAEAEALADSDAEADGLTSGLRELDRRWRDSEVLSVPRQSAADLSRRWRTACDRVADRRRERLEAQGRRDLELLADQAGLCERLERIPEAGTGADPTAAVEADWRTLPTQPNPTRTFRPRSRRDSRGPWRPHGKAVKNYGPSVTPSPAAANSAPSCVCTWRSSLRSIRRRSLPKRVCSSRSRA